jgi:hypothetical protein
VMQCCRLCDNVRMSYVIEDKVEIDAPFCRQYQGRKGLEAVLVNDMSSLLGKTPGSFRSLISHVSGIVYIMSTANK